MKGVYSSKRSLQCGWGKSRQEALLLLTKIVASCLMIGAHKRPINCQRSAAPWLLFAATARRREYILQMSHQRAGCVPTDALCVMFAVSVRFGSLTDHYSWCCGGSSVWAVKFGWWWKKADVSKRWALLLQTNPQAFIPHGTYAGRASACLEIAPYVTTDKCRWRMCWWVDQGLLLARGNRTFV